ncbi:MAG: putative transporter integral rane protein [Thermoleophilia bacterium]|nr:putative transporter integral rane protein [Thermoleophilia bacterium]
MLRVAIKGVLARKLRLLLTSIAVVLGVGFVAGAFFLTDSMRDSFDSLFTEASRGIDVHIQSEEYKELVEKQATSAPGTITIDLARVGVPPTVIEQVKDLEGVDQVAGSIFEFGATVLDKQGKPIQNGGAPAFGANWVAEAEDIGALRLVKGKAPKRDEVLLDATVMETGKFQLGDDVRVLTQGGRKVEEFTVSGVVKFGESNNLNGATITVFETSRAQELFDMGDRFSAVEVKADEGINQVELRNRVRATIGDRYDAITGKEFTNEQTESIDNSFLSIIQNVILGFAAVAVFVGAFTIFNTFTILVGQRTREIGLLRAIGASRRQVLGIVVLEALITGIVASTLGIIAGYGIATALREILGAVGFDLPGADFPLRTRTIVASYLVGVIVTLVASVIPAVRASRLSPLEALRANPAHAGRGWKAPAFGTLLLVGGSLLVLRGFQVEDASVSETLSAIGGGFALAIIGIALLSRIFILPVTKVLSPIFAWGTAGKLATGNVLRNRARSATTASALMIGLALAALVLVFQASLEKTVDAEIDRTLGSDITVYNSAALSSGYGYVDQDDLEEIKQVDGVESVASQYYGGASIGSKFDADEAKIITAFDEPVLQEDGAIKLQVVDGEGEPGDGGVLVDEDIAKDQKWKVGDTARFAFSTDQDRKFEVVGIYEPNEFVGAPAIITKEAFDELQAPAVQAPAFTYVSVEDGRSASKVSDAISKDLGTDGAYLKIQDTEALRDTFRDQLAPILGLVFGMLSLSLIIALFGIGNTLALNVFERTREIGLLRAVGATRRQMRRIIRTEAILVALFGAIVGVLVGLAAGWALVTALKDEGFEFAVNAVPLVAVLGLGIIAGLLAAVFPARRAARTDVLQAIATE